MVAAQTTTLIGAKPASKTLPQRTANVRFGSHKRTFCDAEAMSALPPKADMRGATRDVRFVPIADISRITRSRRRRGRATMAGLGDRGPVLSCD
jgi:hypothetical protein